MKIAIHHRSNGFCKNWVKYCEKNSIPFRLVNCYRNDIIRQVSECDGLMWHFHQSSPKDVLFAKQLLNALNTTGFHVFPDFYTGWHFDDKVGQKYLLEAAGAPLVPSYVFYCRDEALEWLKQTSLPKVFKLRTGAGSSSVRLVEDIDTGKKLINKAFGSGFKHYESVPQLKERWRKYRLGKTKWTDMAKALIRFWYPTEHDRIAGREKGYVYFQDFIPGNTHDIRVNVIDGKASAARRRVRQNDFRASGSGLYDFDITKIPVEAVEIAFRTAERLKLQSVAFDFILDRDNPVIVEMSYGFGQARFTTGYWDSDLNFYEGEFNPFGWMVDSFIKEIEGAKIH